MKNLKIGTRLTFSFGLLLSFLILFLAGIFVYIEWNSQVDAKLRTLQERNRTISTLLALDSESFTLIKLVPNIAQGPEQNAVMDLIGGLSAQSRTHQNKLKELARDEKAIQILDKALSQYQRFSELFEALRQGTDLTIDQFDVQSQFSAYVSTIKDLRVRQDELRQAEMDSSAQMDDFVRLAIVVLGLASLAIGATLSYFITRSITLPLIQAAQIAKAVASGDLTGQVEVKGKDETAQVMLALRDMSASLAKMMEQINQRAQSVAASASEIQGGNQELSTRTDEQASSLAETASAMDELTATVKQNADNARQANDQAIHAATLAREGGAVVDQVVSTMQKIDESSRRVEDIIGVIDGIAFQTNILALNAAVEAARAGEQGKGFAVVAAEVRSLAQRSAAAAKEIKGLITEAVRASSDGNSLTDQAGEKIKEVVDSFERVTKIISEISTASGEQSAGISQINQAVNQMDQVTQQNAALVEQASRSSEGLLNQAHALADMASAFKLPRTSQREDQVQARSPVRAAVRQSPSATTLVKPESRKEPVKTPLKPSLADSVDAWEEF